MFSCFRFLVTLFRPRKYSHDPIQTDYSYVFAMIVIMRDDHLKIWSLGTYGSRDLGEGPAPPPLFWVKKMKKPAPLPLSSSRFESTTVVGWSATYYMPAHFPFSCFFICSCSEIFQCILRQMFSSVVFKTGSSAIFEKTKQIIWWFESVLTFFVILPSAGILRILLHHLEGS